jgi:cell division protein FtsI/penicillin-binding protein 2
MRIRSRPWGHYLNVSSKLCFILAMGLALTLGSGRAEGREDAPGAARGREASPEPGARAAAGLRVDLGGLTQRVSRYLAPVEGGGEAELTLRPHLQQAAEHVLGTYQVPFGAAVVVSIPDGRVLALAARSSVDRALGPAELALRPWAPAASVFKLVSAAALVEEAGLGAASRVCYHGGVSSVLDSNLVDIPALDKRCDTLAFGVGKSQNAIFAKLAINHLSVETLGRTAAAFGFGEPLAFEAETLPSGVEIPETPLEFARASAGFWHSSLSVLHGALVAAAIANGGVMPQPRLVERAVDAAGRPIAIARPPARRVVSPATAREVGRMMEVTTRSGTARVAFRDRRGRRYLPVEVAGKTGSLTRRGLAGDPDLPAGAAEGTHLGYSWFVGYAPAARPTLAFAVLVGNQVQWRIKAPFVAKILVAAHLAHLGDTRVARTLALR